jgi:hypothetical protein
MVKILEVPFLYDAKYRPKGAQKVREKRVRDIAPLGVRELSSKDFPVALRVQDWYIEQYDEEARNPGATGLPR